MKYLSCRGKIDLAKTFNGNPLQKFFASGPMDTGVSISATVHVIAKQVRRTEVMNFPLLESPLLLLYSFKI